MWLLIMLVVASVCGSLVLLHAVVVPLMFKYSTLFQRTVVFCNCLQCPLNTDFEQPLTSGIDGTCNTHIQYNSKVSDCLVKIGVWHVLPQSICNRIKETNANCVNNIESRQLHVDQLKNSDKPVFLYFHGNANSRADIFRVKMYQVLQKMDVHIVAFDYRGFGDSTNINPTEDGVVEDSLLVYEWLVDLVGNHVHDAPIFIWGHSLGTAISSHLFGNIRELSAKYLTRSEPLRMPHGMILQAPFNNMSAEVAHHPLSKLVTFLPYYQEAFVKPFTVSKEFAFKSDQHLAKANSLPVLILHSRDDRIVPFQLGQALYESLVHARAQRGAAVTLRAYDNFGHLGLFMADDLTQVIREFISANTLAPEATTWQIVPRL